MCRPSRTPTTRTPGRTSRRCWSSASPSSRELLDVLREVPELVEPGLQVLRLVGRQDDAFEQVLALNLADEGALDGVDGEVEELLQPVTVDLGEAGELLAQRTGDGGTTRVDGAREAELLQEGQRMLGEVRDCLDGDLEGRREVDREVAVTHPAGDPARQDTLEALGVDVEVIDQVHGVAEADGAQLEGLPDLLDAP